MKKHGEYTEDKIPYTTKTKRINYTVTPNPPVPSAQEQTDNSASENRAPERSVTRSERRNSVAPSSYSSSPTRGRRASDSLSLQPRRASDSFSLPPKNRRASDSLSVQQPHRDATTERRNSTSVMGYDPDFDSYDIPGTPRGSVAEVRRGSFYGDFDDLPVEEQAALKTQNEKCRKQEEEKSEQEAAKNREEAKAQQPLLHNNGFEFVKKLSTGGVSSDSISLYKYNGTNPEIKALLNEDGILVIKFKTTNEPNAEMEQLQQDKINHAKITFDLEWKNINEGLSQHNNDPNLLRPRLHALELEGKKFILNQCIYFDPIEKLDMNLATYLANIGNNDVARCANPDARIEERKKQLDTLFLSMSKAQDQLHEHHFLHLDTATRNLCVLPDGTLKIIDFGGALPMQGIKAVEEKAPYALLPSQSFDQGGLTGAITIKTDLFARRITMMDALAQYMSAAKDTPQPMYYNGLPDHDKMTHPNTFLRTFDDNTRLKRMFDNLMEEAQNLEAKNDIRGVIVKQQLTKYEKYLTVMPIVPENSNVVDVRKSELENFNRCMDPVAAFAKLPESPSHAGMYGANKRRVPPPPPPLPMAEAQPVVQKPETPKFGK